jgi:predicted acetyltransferase
MTDAYPIRPVSEAEWPGFYAVDAEAFNSKWPEEQARELEKVTFEFDRSLAAFDGSNIVGSACVFTFQMTVPGTLAPVAGVSAVGVLPSYRRRGILTSLMRRQLADLSEGGEAVAALFASEPGIYGRFGYGVSSMHSRFSVRRGEGRMVIPAALGAAAEQGSLGPVRLRSVAAEPATTELAKVYEQAVTQRPGMLVRDDRWWQNALADPEWYRGSNGPQRCIVAEDSSGPRGYAVYSVGPDWDTDGLPSSALTVRELMALDPQASAALWADLLSRDLVGEVTARLRPTDDPLLYLLADMRRARTKISDGLWVRIIDIATALAQRHYPREVDVVIEVTDYLLPANAGRWHLQAGPGGTGASCERTSAPVDVALPVASLGAAYLGGTRLGTLARAGLVTELRPGTLAALSTAMSWDPAPWSPMIF